MMPPAPQVQVRTERPEDGAAVLTVTDRAFRQPGAGAPVEVRLLTELRRSAEYLPELSVVAVADGEVVGHAIATRAWVGEARALGLGPVSVVPDWQRRGVGGALLEEIRSRAAAMGERVIVLLGHVDYYPRFGYRPAADLGITAPDPRWGAHFMALPLGTGPVPAGDFRYAEPFTRL